MEDMYAHCRQLRDLGFVAMYVYCPVSCVNHRALVTTPFTRIEPWTSAIMGNA